MHPHESNGLETSELSKFKANEMSLIKLNQNEKSVLIAEQSIQHPLIFKYFDNLPEKERDDAFKRVLQIGVVALMEDRIAAFLSKTENELGTQLESLKLIYELNVRARENTPTSGISAEGEIFAQIRQYLDREQFNDDLVMTGSSTGVLPRNKTGDIVLTVDGSDKKIAIEIKFDQSLALGDFDESNSLDRPRDTAISQMIESNANRNADLAIIIFDQNRSSTSLRNKVNGISWFPSIGFVVVIDDSRGDYTNLFLALGLARSILKSTIRLVDQDIFQSLLGRISQDISTILETQKLLQANQENLVKIAKSIEKHAILVTFTKRLIEEFISTGKVSNENLLKIYNGKELRNEYKDIEAEIQKIFPQLV